MARISPKFDKETKKKNTLVEGKLARNVAVYTNLVQ